MSPSKTGRMVQLTYRLIADDNYVLFGPLTLEVFYYAAVDDRCNYKEQDC